MDKERHIKFNIGADELEKALEFAKNHGGVITFRSMDCGIQKRHQGLGR